VTPPCRHAAIKKATLRAPNSARNCLSFSSNNARTPTRLNPERIASLLPRVRRRMPVRCGRLGAAIPLPKRVSPPVTEVGSSGLTKLLISWENELGLRGSPRGGPSEGRAGNQRDQRESSDKCLHDTSPYYRPLPVNGASAGRSHAPSETRSGNAMFIPKLTRHRVQQSAGDHTHEGVILAHKRMVERRTDMRGCKAGDGDTRRGPSFNLGAGYFHR
jgi:hypothetical protein